VSGEGATTAPPASDELRRLWQRLEIVHAVVYFAPGVQAALQEIGLKGFWMGYFASRAAAMGAVDASVVKATFYNFHPAKVDRAIPDAWALATPEQILEARASAAGAALRTSFEGTDAGTVATAAALAARAARAVTGEGRPLAAAHRALAEPDEAVEKLWWAASVLREHRGDGHVALLTTYAIDGCEAHVLQAATDRVPRETLQAARGWSDDDWAAARERLVARGLVDRDGRITAAGRAAKAEIEDRTDALSAPPYAALTHDDRVALLAALAPLAEAVARGGDMRFPNPIGVDRPDDDVHLDHAAP
jgi:hypothetical protein